MRKCYLGVDIGSVSTNIIVMDKDENILDTLYIRTLGLTKIDNPLLRIATLALPVIPNAKMSDLGMINVLTQDIVSMFDISNK